MSYIQFESSRVREAERQALREAREKILTDAEASFHRKQAQAEVAKEKGDDKWMLPSVEAKLSSNDSSKKKKKKKEKKAKKSKKKKKRSRSSSSSDSLEDAADEWVEKDAETSEISKKSVAKEIQPEKPLERDEWMNLPGSFLYTTQEKKQKKINEEKKKAESGILVKPGQSSRELNPYYKDGGTGLPESDAIQHQQGKLMDATWLKKSFQRAKEQAEEEGRKLEEVAAERWGSLDAIKMMIEEAEQNSRRTYGSGNNWKHGRGSSFSRTNYDRNRRVDDDEKREKRENSSPDHRERSRHRDRDRSRSRSRDRERRRSRERQSEFKMSERKKLAFQRPNEHEHSSASCSGKSSFAAKRWRKPEVNERIIEQQIDTRKSKNVEEKFENSGSHHSDSDDNDKIESDNDKKSENEKVLTEAELNRLGAQIVKAEIMGDTELAASLKSKLELAREIRKNKPAISLEKKPAEMENVILTKVNARGMARPLEPRSLYEEPAGGRRKAKKVDTHESGKRVRYFADDDKFTLQEMFQREKGQSSAENDATFVKMASKSMDMDELFEQRITREESDAKQDARDRTRAIKDHKKLEKSLDHCRWCFDSKEMLKHLIVAMGSKTYVSLPSHVSLTTGHCILAPIHHISCQTQLDEDIWEELQNFKKALTKMFLDKNEFPVFFEMSIGHHRFPHMQLECIPLPEEVGSMAPIYFKKALLECETEWSMNKKVVDLSNKDVRQAVPKGLPYFAVNFGNHGGFAHVIEDEKLFPRNFAQEIIGGILDVDHSLWRKPRRENFDQQRKKVLEFASLWKPYDFTTRDESD